MLQAKQQIFPMTVSLIVQVQVSFELERDEQKIQDIVVVELIIWKNKRSAILLQQQRTRCMKSFQNIPFFLVRII